MFVQNCKLFLDSFSLMILFSSVVIVCEGCFCSTLCLGYAYTHFNYFLHCCLGTPLPMFVQCTFSGGLLSESSYQNGSGSEGKNNTRLLMVDMIQACFILLGVLGDLSLWPLVELVAITLSRQYIEQ